MHTHFPQWFRRRLPAGLGLLLGACAQPTDQAAQTTGAAVDIPVACRPAAPFTIRHPAWATTASLYQVNVRQYTPEGTFKVLEPQLPRLQKMGGNLYRCVWQG